MVISYGVTRENFRATKRLYAERFPNRRHPTRNTISRCIWRFQETGSVLPQHPTRVDALVYRQVNVDEDVLHAFEENPRNSVHRVAFTLGISKSVVHRILRENGLHPFHFQRVQQLLERDEIPRIYFCEGFLTQCRQNILFPDCILWTDEATFTPNGVFNSHNYVTWEDENPHAVRQTAFQYRWSINVCVGVMANRVVNISAN